MLRLDFDALVLPVFEESGCELARRFGAGGVFRDRVAEVVANPAVDTRLGPFDELVQLPERTTQGECFFDHQRLADIVDRQRLERLLDYPSLG